MSRIRTSEFQIMPKSQSFESPSWEVRLREKASKIQAFLFIFLYLELAYIVLYKKFI